MANKREFWKEDNISPSEFMRLVADLQIGNYTPKQIGEILSHPYYDSHDINIDNLNKKGPGEGVDIRHIKCGCNDPACRIGLSFDTNPAIMRLHDKYGNEHGFQLTKNTINEIIDYLQDQEASL